MNSRWAKVLALIIFYLGMARAMASFWEFSVPVYVESEIAALIEGRGGYPAQYRILGPWIINFISGTFHLHLATAELLFYWLAFFLSFFALRFWLLPFLPRPVCDLSPVWLIALSVGNVGLRYTWDALTFIFTPLLLGLLYRKKWVWLVIAFSIATLARETNFLIVFALAVFAIYSKAERKTLLLLSILCSAIWVIEKFALIKLYGGSSSSAVIWQLKENIKFLTGNYLPIDENMTLAIACQRTSIDWILKRWGIFYTYPAYLLTLLSWANFAWVLMFPRWRKKDIFLQRVAWLIPIHFAIMFFIGVIFEKRIYFELYPIVIALGLQTFFEGQKS